MFDPLGVVKAAPVNDPLLGSTNTRISNIESKGYATAADRRAEEKAFVDSRGKVLRDFKSADLIRVGTKLLEENTDVKTDANRARELLEKVERSNEKKKDKRARTTPAGSMTQQELIDQLDNVVKDMEIAWEEDRKVDTLKAVIECVHHIESVTQPSMYPYIAVLVHKFLDAFGNLVFTRVMRRVANPNLKPGQPPPTRIPTEIPDDVPAAASSMARNWLYKIGCIRELIPRLYIEASLLRLNFFFKPSRATVRRNVMRMMAHCRAVGDPLVATYARMYLIHVVAMSADTEIVSEMAALAWHDWLATMPQWRSDGYAYKALAAEHGLSSTQYELYMLPAIERVVAAMARGAAAPSFDAMLAAWSKDVRVRGALRALVAGYPDAAVGPHVRRVIDLALSVEGGADAKKAPKGDDDDAATAEASQQAARDQAAGGTSLPMWRIYEVVGAAAAAAPPADKRARLSLLNEAWESISAVAETSLSDYIRCCKEWLPYVTQHLGAKQVSLILRDVKENIDAVEHTAADAVDDAAAAALGDLLTSFSDGGVDVTTILATDDFLPLMDHCALTERIAIAAALLRRLLASCAGAQEGGVAADADGASAGERGSGTTSPTAPSARGAAAPAGPGELNEPVLITSGLELCRELHDAAAHMSSDDERKDAETLILRFVDCVWHGNTLPQLDKTYSFIAELPHAFPRLDSVAEVITLKCMRVVATVMATCDLRQKTRKPAQFAQNGLAFCHMSIPSIPDLLTQARLFTQCATLALCANYLPQADLLFRAALSAAAAVPPTTQLPSRAVVSNDTAVLEVLATAASSIVLAPGHPEDGPLYLVEALLALIETRQWDARGGAADAAASRAFAYMSAFSAVSALARPTLPYHCPEPTRHNDTLFAFNSKYAALCSELAARAVDGFLEAVAEAYPGGAGGAAGGGAVGRRVQRAVLEGVSAIVAFADFEQFPKWRKVIPRLLQLTANPPTSFHTLTVADIVAAADKSPAHADIAAALLR